MKINKMRHNIVILRKEPYRNDFGETSYTYVPFIRLKARKQRLANETSTAAAKDKFTETYRFIIRYNKNIKLDNKLEYNGEMYNITHINHILELDQCESHIECVKHEEDVRN